MGCAPYWLGVSPRPLANAVVGSGSQLAGRAGMVEASEPPLDEPLLLLPPLLPLEDDEDDEAPPSRSPPLLLPEPSSSSSPPPAEGESLHAAASERLKRHERKKDLRTCTMHLCCRGYRSQGRPQASPVAHTLCSTVSVLWFLTDAARPALATRDVVAAIATLDGVLVQFRDKRAGWDRNLLADLARMTPRLVVNIAAECRETAASFGALGWHAPEAVWRSLDAAPPHLFSVADHDGAGVAFAARVGVRHALVSPIWIDKGSPARGVAALEGRSSVQRIALGGVVSAREAALAAQAGASGVAVQRALYQARDPAALARTLLEPFLQCEGRAAERRP